MECWLPVVDAAEQFFRKSFSIRFAERDAWLDSEHSKSQVLTDTQLFRPMQLNNFAVETSDSRAHHLSHKANEVVSFTDISAQVLCSVDGRMTSNVLSLDLPAPVECSRPCWRTRTTPHEEPCICDWQRLRSQQSLLRSM